MIDDHRNRILHAAARVYAQHGWRGATTRRIAEEAGVNEVTIFRQFGSKDALLDIAMRECSRVESETSLPHEPVHPENELTAWASANYERIGRTRDIVRQMISDACERPDAMECAKHGPSAALAQLREYVVQLRRDGWISETDGVRPADVAPAISMLLGAVINDAMNRDMMPELFPHAVADTLRAYVRIFLRGVGARPEPTPRGARTAPAPLTPSASHVE
jgi:AcrR family transcriptional regulator